MRGITETAVPAWAEIKIQLNQCFEFLSSSSVRELGWRKPGPLSVVQRQWKITVQGGEVGPGYDKQSGS
jgi:hypothetical protein